MVVDIFASILEEQLRVGITTPGYEKISTSLYIKMAQIDSINALMPLPRGVALHDYPELLAEYFTHITRLEDLSSI